MVLRAVQTLGIFRNDNDIVGENIGKNWKWR